MTCALDRLADLAGIQPEYPDIWGRTHVAAPETKRVLLAAMGISCNTDDEAASSLRAWEAAVWRRLLPPVFVAATGSGEVVLPLRVPAADMGRPGRWRLELESGGGFEGGFHPRDLPVEARTTVDGVDYLTLAFKLPACEAWGYHRLEIVLDDLPPVGMRLIACPATCYRPESLRDNRRVWGVSAQLYGVRSQRNWGMGDFTDLQGLVEWAAANGAGLVGVNPLHALFPHNPKHFSPYSPSSRSWLNVLYIDVESVPEFAECPTVQNMVGGSGFRSSLDNLRAASLVDYAGVAALKLRVLKLLYRHFRDRHLGTGSARADDFRRFQHDGGDDLRGQALFEALQAHFHARDDRSWGWPVWPRPYQDRASPEVAAWAAENVEAVEYYQYLQWLAATQLAAAARKCDALGLAVGLYQDLAVGVDRGGAETWVHRELYAFEASVGAPPDDFNLHGQDWGLPPFIPHRLRDAAYEPFIRLLRANMREAGALRIDHVMSLMRLYWIPPGMRADEGVYVSYPFRDLLGIVALESQRNRCLVIGEDLGTVPDAVRSALQEMGILAYRLFYFEKRWDWDQRFRLPCEIYPEALVAVSTHDLATLSGWWRGDDLDLRTRLHLFPSEEVRQSQVAGRQDDRWRLLQALEREQLLPEGMAPDPAAVQEMSVALAIAVHRYLARSPARVMLMQAEDMLGEMEQANLPGTIDGHPNWQRKLSLNLEEWHRNERLPRFIGAMKMERGSSVHPPLPSSGSGG
jgi:(1->4)-alpha-D-glucan 1-alpha-D-glucosylmutase